MQKLILLFLGVFSLTSCTTVYKTHSEVMDLYNSKERILEEFGVPHQKRTEGDLEEWVYDYGTYGITRINTTIPSINTNTQTNTFKPIGNSNPGLKFASGAVKVNSPQIAYSTARTDTYSKTVLFRFKNDELIDWKTNGVNYQIKVKSPKKTAWLITSSVVGTYLILKLTEPQYDETTNYNY